MKFRDLSGQRFGRLTVTKRAEDHMDGDRKRVMFSCTCDCGERHLTRAYSLLSGRNHLLGNSKESIEILEKAIQYLRRHHGK